MTPAPAKKPAHTAVLPPPHLSMEPRVPMTGDWMWFVLTNKGQRLAYEDMPEPTENRMTIPALKPCALKEHFKAYRVALWQELA